MQFIETERNRQVMLVENLSLVFYGASNRGVFQLCDKGQYFEKPSRAALKHSDRDKNLYAPIREDVNDYFQKYGIKFWSANQYPYGQEPEWEGRIVTNHILSSQVACLNHLFHIRRDRDMVGSLANTLTGEIFDDVVEIPYDEGESNFISFEVVSHNDYLNEDSGTGLSRGEYCTSIDALIIGKKEDKLTLIPIEWKYTEKYNDTDLSKETFKGKGKTRLKRYEGLINSPSTNLKRVHGDAFFYTEPFYQLMRQTLWAEQVIEHKEINGATDYIHVHVVPRQNHELMNKQYPCANGETMVEAWTNSLKDACKYHCVDPSIIADILSDKYPELSNYLKTRYGY